MSENAAVAESGDAQTTGSPKLEATRGMTCFVVMPFGEKTHPRTGNVIDFDEVYRKLIKPVVESLGLKCTRSDEVSVAGLIHRDMIDRILNSDLVIVDITTGNPNVMYELGVRHAAKRWGTIIIKRSGPDSIPFNISGLRAVDYDIGANDALDLSQHILKTNIQNSLDSRSVDSLVHTLFSGLNVTRRALPIQERKVFVWSSPKAPRTKICIVWGDHKDIDMIDLWVNPENTKLQMGRFHDNSISSYIRYWGAKRDVRGAVIRDRISENLASAVRQAYSVEPGTVVVTSPGGLWKTNRVRAVVHVAAQHGEPGKGYRTISGYADCVANVLDAAERYNRCALRRFGVLSRAKSILFPLFGTRASGIDPQSIATGLVRAAKTYVELWPELDLERIYFQAYTDADDELCTTAFSRLGLTYEGSEPQ